MSTSIEISRSRAWCAIDDCVTGWIGGFDGFPPNSQCACCVLYMAEMNKRSTELVDEILKKLCLEKWRIDD